MMRILPLLLALIAVPAATTAAWAQNPFYSIRADNWTDAQATAAQNADPLAQKLVTYYRLMAPGQASAAEIGAFMTANPDWPSQAQLDKRRQEALATDPDDNAARIECDRQLPGQTMKNPLALQRCATAYDAGGRHEDAMHAAAASDAARDTLPAPMLAEARNLRTGGQDDAALALWLAQGTAAQQGDPTHLPQYWTERHALARQLLRDGNNQGAYDLVAAHGQTAGEQLADAEFLAGFIALRRLNKPDLAAGHFRTLTGASRAAITQGRAWYWLGRAEAAGKRDPRASYEKAAAWPTTFYGQLASRALGEDDAALSRRITTLRDPAFDQQQVTWLSGRELARAAALLTGWNEQRRAHSFLLRLDELGADPSNRALAAHYAAALGQPEMAVAIARRMGRDGLVLPDAGWPMPFDPPATAGVDPATALGLMRQESSFEAAVVSPAGARGLMQLMPGTAQLVAKQTGDGYAQAMLSEPNYNMRLGTTYLAGLLQRFGGSVPLAMAGYNAGPNRVDRWLTDNGDPRAGGSVDMVDWIELIPISETRNYVQRVLENISVYRAKRGESGPSLLADRTN